MRVGELSPEHKETMIVSRVLTSNNCEIDTSLISMDRRTKFKTPRIEIDE